MQEFADREQLYGPLYMFADHKPGEHIRYHAFDGSTRTGEILWILEPGRTVGTHQPIRAQYVVNPDEDRGMPDFVNLGDVIDESPAS